VQLTTIKNLEAELAIFELQGDEVLGSILIIACQADTGRDISTCLVHWYRVIQDNSLYV
jgi:Ig domain of plant-specific actin-binding protein